MAYVVKYVYKPDSPTARRWPVIVTVKAPVAAGQEKDLLKDGELSRVMGDASAFPKMIERDHERLVAVGLHDRSGQVWVRSQIGGGGRRLDGRDRQSGQVWVRSRDWLL